MTDDRAPRLDWTEDGAPVSGRFGDVYFSREDGLAESRAVFLAGCGLPDAWAERRHYTVGELGFGTGLNIVALIDLWLNTRPEGGRLYVFSVEAYPLTRDDATRALAAWPDLAPIAQALIAAWPDGTPGFHRLPIPADWGVTLDLAVAPVERALADWDGRADAWFLDGFAPATNPDMWSEAVLAAIGARSAPGARVATFTVAGAVRRGLQAAGFEVEKRPGHGRKRERLEARAAGVAQDAPLPGRVAVIGGGVAGLATARALLAAGMTPVLAEADVIGAGASGFPAALVTPRLDAGDADLAALFAQALRRAAALYDTVEGAVVARGVIQLEHSPRDTKRFDRIAAQSIWAQGDIARLSALEASELLGEAVETAGLSMGLARAIRPSTVLAAWARGIEVATLRVASVEESPDGVVLQGEDGTRLPFGAAVLTGGWGNAALAPELKLRPVRGQADWAEGQTSPPVAWGGYAVPTGTGLLFGATHDRDRIDEEASVHDAGRNLETLRARLPALAARVEGLPVRSRVAVRATTSDRLPVAGQLRPRVFILGGLGSRGFALAPLLGEHVAALVAGVPSPLPRPAQRRVAPIRLAEQGRPKDR